mmetsp:Transcript_12111/g.32666  ORF Transcript_12111/g.32666 Transcript_12111/m.32666 type:complete len:94 (+) Transcript_12111:228-509(+)
MLTLSSVFGGGKVGTKQTSAAVTPYIEYCQATQEADNVLILQKGDAYKFIDVKKNRFDGDLGRIPISFRKDAGVYRELGDQEVQQIEDEKFAL